MAPREPGVRAGSAQDMMAYLDRHRPGLTGRVRARMPPDMLERFDATGRTGFLPLEVDGAFVDAMYAEMGRRGIVDAVGASVAQHFESPLLRTLVGSAKRLFGMTPLGLMRILPRGWALVYRGLAEPSLAAHEGNSVTLRLSHVHEYLFAHPGYPASFEGIVVGVLGVTNHDGRVATTEDPAAQVIDIRASW